MPRVILHIDMDAFFASVEQRDHPPYRGKPVIVGSSPQKRGVVCAASYEARQFGVRSAMPSRTAGRLCPAGIFLQPRMDVYRQESDAILRILESYTPLVEKVSIDEAYLDLSAAASRSPDPDHALRSLLPLAHDIQNRIAQERELTASIGVAPNKFLAKLGSDYSKPKGLTLILESEKVAFLRPLPLRSIHGVGPRTAEALEARGLHSIADLQDCPLALEAVVGGFASTLRRRALGEDDRPVEPEHERKSISSEHTFAADTAHRPTLRTALREMARDVAGTLQRHHTGARTVQVKVRYTDFTTLTRQIRMEESVRSEAEIYRIGCHLLATHALVRKPLRLLGLGVTGLDPEENPQLRLALEERA
jgi:DNA polymerase-4